MKLVNFNLIDLIKNLDLVITIPKRIRTVLFISIEILYSTSPLPRQVQHKDETAFWFRLLALFKHYFKSFFMQSTLSDHI